jgi:hypothetical protein
MILIAPSEISQRQLPTYDGIIIYLFLKMSRVKKPKISMKALIVNEISLTNISKILYSYSKIHQGVNIKILTP